MTEKRVSFKGGRRDLPSDWAKRKKAVHDRDGWRCTATLASGKRCPRGKATGHKLDCDHVGSKWSHSLENLTSLCEHHHDEKTSAQGIAAREAKYNPKRRSPKRVEQHPGLIRRPRQEEA